MPWQHFHCDLLPDAFYSTPAGVLRTDEGGFLRFESPSEGGPYLVTVCDDIPPAAPTGLQISSLCQEVEPTEYLGIDGLFLHTPFREQFITEEVDNGTVGTFNALGITQYAFMGPLWFMVEPRAPVSEVHQYQWETTDSAVANLQGQGAKYLQLQIGTRSSWASTSTLHGGPPKAGYWDDYELFVQALAERYDKDGVNDMPGLLYPVEWFQIDNEASTYWPTNGWTATEYMRLLEHAYAGIKRANPNAIVMPSADNCGDIFDDDPSAEVLSQRQKLPRVKASLEFIDAVLDNPHLYDVFATHCNYSDTGIGPQIRWFRREMSKRGVKKPIWVTDTACARLLNQHQFQPETYPDEPGIAAILDDPTHPEHEHTWQWWMQEQVTLTTRKLHAGLEAGVDKMFISWPFEIPARYRPDAVDPGWAYVGILNLDGTPRPVFFALDDFIRCTPCARYYFGHTEKGD